MTIIFGYDKIDKNNEPVPNGFIPDYENNISAINLGFAGYDLPEDVVDEDLQKLPEKFKLKNHVHYSNLRNFFDIEVQKVDEIKEKYFYIVDVFPYAFWVDDHSKDITIGDKALKDIKKGQCKILVLFIQEPLNFFLKPEKILESWIEKYNLPKNSIIVSCGNYLGKDYFESHSYIEHVPYSVWENLDFNKDKHSLKLRNLILENKTRSKIFLSYNRRPHFHRIKFVYSLFEEKILNLGLVSMSSIPESCSHDIDKNFLHMLPMTIGDVDLNINQASNLTTIDFENTYFSIVTETTIEKNIFFPSEKIFKSIVSFHPFFVIASPFFLENLRKLGYKTFSKWFDESYDKEENLETRIETIINEIKRLSKSNLSDMLIDMLPVLQHNYNIWLDRTSNPDYLKRLTEELYR
jgi:hypothetical protein